VLRVHIGASTLAFYIIVFRSLRVHIGASTLAFYIIVFRSLRVHIGTSTLAFYIIVKANEPAPICTRKDLNTII
jgi:hypothetical protein